MIAKLGLTGGLAAAGLAAVCILWFVLRARLAALRRARRIAAEATEIEDFRRTVSELLVELDQSAARVASQIQDHFARLTDLQRDVDDKLRRFTLAGGAAATTVVAERTSPSEPATQPNVAIPRMRSRKTQRRVETADTPPIEPVAALHDPRIDNVLALSDAGETPIRIAESTGMLLGEVELLLALREYR